MKNKTLGLMLIGIMSLPQLSNAQIDKIGVNASLFHQDFKWKTNRIASLQTSPGIGLNLNLETYLGSIWTMRGGVGLQTFQVSQNLKDVPSDEYSPKEQLSIRQAAIDLDFKRYFPGCGVHPYLVFGGRTAKTFSMDYDIDMENENANMLSISNNNFDQWQFSAQAGFGLEFNGGLFIEGGVRRDFTPSFVSNEDKAFGYQATVRLGYYFQQASTCRKKRLGVIGMF